MGQIVFWLALAAVGIGIGLWRDHLDRVRKLGVEHAIAVATEWRRTALEALSEINNASPHASRMLAAMSAWSNADAALATLPEPELSLALGMLHNGPFDGRGARAEIVHFLERMATGGQASAELERDLERG